MRPIPTRTFPLPWTFEGTGCAFKVRDGNGQSLALVHYSDTDSGAERRLLTKKEAKQIAENIAALPKLRNK